MRYTVFSFLIFVAFGVSAQQEQGPSVGYRQSPINIEKNMALERSHALRVHYEASHEHIEHGPHAVKVVYDPGSFVSFDGIKYDFRQLHYHTPSEHYLEGVQYPVEMHMVHEYHDGAHTTYLVISILYEFGEEDQFLKRFIDEVPEACIDVDYADKSINVAEEFVPGDLDDYFHYRGSLTTPPYTEGVDWLVLSTTHQMSADQIVHLSELEGRNNRELQSIEDVLLEHCTAQNPF